MDSEVQALNQIAAALTWGPRTELQRRSVPGFSLPRAVRGARQLRDMGQTRVVLHDVDALLAYDVAAEIFFEINSCLQGHAEVAGLVIGISRPKATRKTSA